MPPVTLELNPSRYKAHTREDDISWVGPPIWNVFRIGKQIALKKNLVIGHVLMSNPFSSSIAVNLNLNKGLDLKVIRKYFQIGADFIDIRYFAYDPMTREVGSEKALFNGSAIISSNETVVAKFILTREFPVRGIDYSDDHVRQSLSFELGFSQSKDNKGLADGLTLTTRDPGAGLLSSQYTVPWGSEYHIRRRYTR